MDKQAPGSPMQHCPHVQYWFTEFSDFFWKATLRGAAQSSRGWYGTCLNVYWSFSRKGREHDELSWVSDFPVHIHGQVALVCPLHSWASCRMHFRKKGTLPSHCKGGGVGDTMEEAAVSVGTRPYWIHSMSEKKKPNKLPLYQPLRSWDCLLLKDNLAYLGSGTHYQAHKITPTSPVPTPHI